MTAFTRLSGAMAALLSLTALPAMAQEVTLKLHHFLPPQSTIPTKIVDVWADRIEAASDGRIEIERFPGMQLGGTPPELMDQVVDGVADIMFTVAGYTPGRFPKTEVFELPFFTTDARAASYAYWTLFEEEMQDDFPGVKVLATWVHGPGMIHTNEPVLVPGDLEGLKVRGGSRLVNALLAETGAEPVGMPVPAVPEALSKGVIDATTIPWEVTSALRVAELVEFHTEFEENALYTLTFVLAMNQGAYDAMPADLQAIFDANSGLELSIYAGGIMLEADAPAREIAVDEGNEITVIPVADQGAWRDAVAPIYDQWLGEMSEKGLDGQALIERARALMSEYDPALDTFANQ